ncbi:MAG: hypothetical protein ABI806_05930 [Candidatus Solibacter sp.]
MALRVPFRSTQGKIVRGTFEAILSYLSKHPEATDTLQGVMWWWLLEEPAPPSSAHVKAALDEAVQRGLIMQIKAGDGQLRYALAPGKLPEICKLLDSDPDLV